MSAAPVRRRFSPEEYHCMGEAGIIGPEERTELIEGDIYVLPPIGPGHAEGVWSARTSLERAVGTRARVRIQDPVRLPNGSEPEPDIVIARLRPEGYKLAHPTPEDILLIVEVSDSTLTYDSQTKMRIYAAAGILEAWLINLRDDCVVVHRAPQPDGYRTRVMVRRGGTLTPLAFPDISIRCDDILP